MISVWLCSPECCSKSVCIFTYHMSVQHSILISSHLSLYYIPHYTVQSNAYCALCSMVELQSHIFMVVCRKFRPAVVACTARAYSKLL